MTQPVPVLENLKWEDALLQVLEMPAVDRTRFTDVPWISVVSHNVIHTWLQKHETQRNADNEFSFYRYVGTNHATDGNLTYLHVVARVNWFVGGEGESPNDLFYRAFWDRSRDTVLSPTSPLLLDPKSFHDAAETMYNAESWLIHAIAELQREIDDLSSGQSTFSGAAATAFRGASEKLRKEMQVLRDNLQSSKNWSDMLHNNGHAAEKFWTDTQALWSAWSSYGIHRPNEIIARVLDQLMHQVRFNPSGSGAVFNLEFGDGNSRPYNFEDPSAISQLDNDMRAVYKLGLNYLDQEMRRIYGALRDSLDDTTVSMLTPAPPPGDTSSTGGPDTTGGTDGSGTTGGLDGTDIKGGTDGLDTTGGPDTTDGPDTGGAEDSVTTGGPGSPDIGDLPPAGSFESNVPGLGLEDGFQSGVGTDTATPGVGSPSGFTGGGFELGELPDGTPGLGLGAVGGSTGGLGALPPGGFAAGGLGSIGGSTGGSGRPSPNDDKPGSGVIGGPAGDFDEGPITIDTDDLPGGKPLPGMFGGTGSEIGGEQFGGAPGERATAGAVAGGMQIGQLGSTSSMPGVGAGTAATPASGGPMGSAMGPMGPMSPMGGGGMGGAEEKDRERKTWLAEEEELWGTETDLLNGVIGRDDNFDRLDDSNRPAVPQSPGAPYAPSHGTSRRQSRGY